MSSPKQSLIASSSNGKVAVKISKQTGGAYADMRDVIESELARIKEQGSCKHENAELPRNNNGRPS